MDILNNNEREQLLFFKNKFKNDETTKFQKLTEKQKKDLITQLTATNFALDSFESQKFVITCIGMLKAGKSTLVNLFSRNKLASPTGFGVDTTLRPALITYTEAKQGCIEIWFPNNPDSNQITDDKNILNEVFSCIRGIKNTKQVQSASVRTYTLTEDNLKTALCSQVMVAAQNMLPSEPVMVAVKVPQAKDSLLNSEITILDTPGLDSGISEWTRKNSKRYQWIIEHSDLILFLQSSAAPLNQNAQEVIKMIRAQKPQTPIWLIQNEMILKPWYSHDKIEKINQEQRAQAARMFDNLNKTFKKVYANLGKADTAILDSEETDKNEELLRDSNFCTMEKNVLSELKTNCGPIRRRNCVENVKRETNTLKSQIESIQNGLDSQSKSLDEKKCKLENSLKKFSDMLLDPPDTKKFRILANSSEIKLNDDFTGIFRNILNNAFNQDFTANSYTAQALSKKISDIRDALVNQIIKYCQELTLPDFYFILQGNGAKISVLQTYILENFRNHIKSFQGMEPEFSGHVEQCLKNLELPQLSLPIWIPSTEPIVVPKKPGFFNFLGVQNKYTKTEAKEEFLNYYNPNPGVKDSKFANLINDGKNFIKDKLLNWVNNEAYKKLRSDFLTTLKGKIDQETSRLQKEVQALDHDRASLENIKTTTVQLLTKMEFF